MTARIATPRRHPLVLIRLLAPAVVLGALWAGCGGDGPTEPPGDGEPEVASIEVVPGADTLTALGDTVALTAVAQDAAGNEIPGVTFTWSTSNQSVVAVDGDIAVAVGNGSAAVTASAEGVTGTAELAVAQRVSTVTVEPASATLTTVGSTQQFTASAVDANGNAVSDAPFVWASEDHTVATVDPDGLATAKGSGEIAITATAQDIPGHATLTVDQQIDHLAFLGQPTATTAGVVFDPAIQVEVQDADGQRVADAGIAVTLAIGTNPAGGTLTGTKTVNAINGVASFSGLWIDRAAAGYTLSAASTGVPAGSSAAFDITPAAAVALAFMTPPSDSVTAGEPLGVQVAVVDEFGNTVTNATDAVTLALSTAPERGALVGSTTESAIDGVATFDAVSIELAEPGYALEAGAAGLVSVQTDAFEVTPALPHHVGIAMKALPSAHAKRKLNSLLFAVHDTFDNVVDTSTAQVSVSIGGGYPGATVEGQLTVNAVDGVARFDSVAIDKPGEYDLLASSPGIADATFAAVAYVLPRVYGMSGGAAHSCMQTPEGPFCWGANDAGQLGAATASPLGDSVAVAVETDSRLDWIGPGVAHTCGVAEGGSAYCWGDNASGQLGDGNLGTSQPVPVSVAGGLTYNNVSAGDQHTCGVGTDDLAYCWGANDQGQLGAGTIGGGSDVPVLVTDSITFMAVFAGDNHTCGWAQDSAAYCWGDNADGQLGDGNLGVDSPSPVAVQGGTRFQWLDAGARHNCGIDPAGTVLCWGANEAGQLDGGSTDSDVPVDATTVTSLYGGPFGAVVSAGGSHTCVLKGPGEGIWCWGDNGSGQLGRATTGGTAGPFFVQNSDRLEWLLIGAGGAHTCAYADDQDGLIEPDAGEGLGEGYHCWGANGNGQLGDGTTVDANVLTRMVQGF